MRWLDSWTSARVKGTRDLTPQIREITLAPAAQDTRYSTGAHLRVRVLIDGRSDLRHYSLIGLPKDGEWRIAVKREDQGRGGSRFMWSLKLGDEIEVAYPSSHFELSPTAPFVLLIAGGIGITPMVGMAEALQRRGQNFRFLYAARDPAEMAYRDELQARFGAQIVFYFDTEKRFIDLTGEFTALPTHAECYVCGPIGLLDAAKRVWAETGRPQPNLRFETFGSSGRYPSLPFKVLIPRMEREIDVPPELSLLDALEQAGIDVLADCRRGECGLCALDVIETNAPIDHRDVFFSPAQHEENRKVCACVSRAAGGTLVLDCAYRG